MFDLMGQWVHLGGAHCTMTMVPYYTSPSQFDNGIQQIKPQLGIMLAVINVHVTVCLLFSSGLII